MKYTSTRDPSKLYTFEEAILSGYAPDGSLFVPETLPTIDSVLLQEWSSLSFVELAHQVLRMFISVDELDDSNLSTILKCAFETKNNGTGYPFPDNLTSSPPIPVIKTIPGIYIAELFHGPTYCFKDFGMRTLVNFLGHFATQRKTKITLIASTTGDTGPAAVQAIQDLPDAHRPYMSILVHYPEGQISDFQRKQLTTLQSDKIQIVAFQGGGDDMDLPIKNILKEPTKKKDDDKSSSSRRITCGINSYNIGRPLMQMVHFIWTYLRVAEDLKIPMMGDPNYKVDIVIPTGAMGNIVGGYMAKCMGVPFGTFCAGVNINDITHTVIQTGHFYRSDVAMQMTLSEAINIQLPYNFERLLFYLTDSNYKLVKEWYSNLEGESKRMILPTEWHEKLQAGFRSARITDEDLCSTLVRVYDTYKYWADPHTGVALAAAEQLGYLQIGTKDGKEASSSSSNKNKTNTPVAVMATASPCKFQKAVTVAMGEDRWKEYVLSGEFPIRAQETLQLPEKDPIIYPSIDGKTFEQNQIEWEKLARALVGKF